MMQPWVAPVSIPFNRPTLRPNIDPLDLARKVVCVQRVCRLVNEGI